MTLNYVGCLFACGFTGGEDSCASVESLVNWLLEHDDPVLDELSDDSDMLYMNLDDSPSDEESLMVDVSSVNTDDEVGLCVQPLCVHYSSH